jgi:uncharacterized protein DUF4202
VLLAQRMRRHARRKSTSAGKPEPTLAEISPLGYGVGMSTAAERRARAISAFQSENAKDPNMLEVSGVSRPKELVYAERLAAWVERLKPEASEALVLASHCQHLRRWELARSEFDAGRIGYLSWRKALARFHADQATEILRELGYDEELRREVRKINLKQGLQTQPDVQTMEDALCLSFLEHELEEFASKHPDAKVVHIIRKTWGKMSERAQRVALGLTLPERAGQLVQQALEPGGAAESRPVAPD